MPWALMHLVDGALDNILCWHGGGDRTKEVDGTLELTDKDILSLGLNDKYFDVILASREQLMSLLHWDDQSKEGAHGPNTRGALKHPAWDCLSDTSPKGWMEFFKSLVAMQ